MAQKKQTSKSKLRTEYSKYRSSRNMCLKMKGTAKSKCINQHLRSYMQGQLRKEQKKSK